MSNVRLTVLYESPYWVGVVERQDDAGYAVSRFIFGAEPSEAEVLEFVLTNHRRLRFSTPIVGVEPEPLVRKNPKRVQREARAEMEKTGLSSHAQEALRLDLETRKKERRVVSKAEREAEAQRKFDLRQQKKKQKARGH